MIQSSSLFTEEGLLVQWTYLLRRSRIRYATLTLEAEKLDSKRTRPMVRPFTIHANSYSKFLSWVGWTMSPLRYLDLSSSSRQPGWLEKSPGLLLEIVLPEHIPRSAFESYDLSTEIRSNSFLHFF